MSEAHIESRQFIGWWRDTVSDAMTSSGHTGERAIHSSDFSAEKNPVGSVRSLAANAASRSLFREQGLRGGNPRRFSIIGSLDAAAYGFGNDIPNTPSWKRCLSGPLMNQQHTVGSNRQDLRNQEPYQHQGCKTWQRCCGEDHPAATQISSRGTPLKELERRLRP